VALLAYWLDHLLIYLQGDLLVCDVIGRYDFCVVLLAGACDTNGMCLAQR